MKKISFKDLVSMVLSCVICSIAVNWVALPNGFVVTGITGLAMTAQAFTGINYALIYYGLMLLILVLTFVALGYREVSNILFLSFLYPLVLWVLNHWTVEIILKEKLIAVMFFGVIYGVGAGITYRLGYSYGGTDTLAKILKTKVLKAVELKHILLALDGMIMAVMLLRFSLDVVAYALVGQIIYVNSMNYVIFNMGPKLYEIQIVCENSKAIEAFVIHEIHKSATLSQVTGSYSGQTKTQVDCVCNSREYVQLREFIRDQGVDCFIKVFPLTHVFGQNKDFHRLSDQNLE
ncbi:YitT family protein [Pseudoflavonifractor phocaeensis]|uniref:YitT family protein n=1 Tax=Pseudoflavonifractor phocaeensis TaxID=1870988 RepID=UPI0025A3236C|nr:YitT family protein [Pseudoflavonifractor phocaeensis]MDM8238711.1 YitT family protein [Pseudoflavonifractor phocaeensis]